MSNDVFMVTMRFADCTVFHPQQNLTHNCAFCGQRLCMFPAGVRTMQREPTAKPICTHCAELRFAQDPEAVHYVADHWREDLPGAYVARKDQ